MKNIALKESLVVKGQGAFLNLTVQIHRMLDVIDLYFAQNPVTVGKKSDTIAFKQEELKLAINVLGSVPYQLAEVVRRWKHDEPRTLSKIGVETTLLNEIWATLETTNLFFTLEGIDTAPFDRELANKAFAELITVNKLLD
jgi:hypothetical protein